jgi:hypothetical protein
MTDFDLVCLPPDGKVPDRERVIVESKQVVLAIVWDPTGFAVVTALESGCKLKTGYYMSKVQTRLSEWWRERGCWDF